MRGMGDVAWQQPCLRRGDSTIPFTGTLPTEPTPKRRRLRGAGAAGAAGAAAEEAAAGAADGDPGAGRCEWVAPSAVSPPPATARVWHEAHVRRGSPAPLAPLACTVNICVPEGGAVRFPQLEQGDAPFKVCFPPPPRGAALSQPIAPALPPVPPPQRPTSPPPPSPGETLFWRRARDRGTEQTGHVFQRHSLPRNEHLRNRSQSFYADDDYLEEDDYFSFRQGDQIDESEARLREFTLARAQERALKQKAKRKKPGKKPKTKAPARPRPSLGRRFLRALARLFGCASRPRPVPATQPVPATHPIPDTHSAPATHPAIIMLPVATSGRILDPTALQNLVQHLTYAETTVGPEEKQEEAEKEKVDRDQESMETVDHHLHHQRGKGRRREAEALEVTSEQHTRQHRVAMATSQCSTDTVATEATGGDAWNGRPRRRALRRRRHESLSSAPPPPSPPPSPLPSPTQCSPAHLQRPSPERYLLDVSIRFSDEMAPSVTTKLVSPTGYVRDIPTGLFPQVGNQDINASYDLLLPKHPFTSSRWKLLARQMPCVAELQKHMRLSEQQSDSSHGSTAPRDNADVPYSSPPSPPPYPPSRSQTSPSPQRKPFSSRKSLPSPDLAAACSLVRTESPPRKARSPQTVRRALLKGPRGVEGRLPAHTRVAPTGSARGTTGGGPFLHTDEFLQLMRERYGPVAKANSELREIMRAIRENQEATVEHAGVSYTALTPATRVADPSMQQGADAPEM